MWQQQNYLTTTRAIEITRTPSHDFLSHFAYIPFFVAHNFPSHELWRAISRWYTTCSRNLIYCRGRSEGREAGAGTVVYVKMGLLWRGSSVRSTSKVALSSFAVVNFVLLNFVNFFFIILHYHHVYIITFSVRSEELIETKKTLHINLFIRVKICVEIAK